MECKFFVGQKVVCIHDKSYTSIPLEGVTKGEIYTIARIGIAGPFESHEGEVVVWLEEVRRTRFVGATEPGYLYSRFNPLTDISVFQEMLNTVSELETV